MDEMSASITNYFTDYGFRKALGIPNIERIPFALLGQGEYNVNYKFYHPYTQQALVLRINTGSQMHLEKQITYEYEALKLLSPSGRTPKPYFVDETKKKVPYGVLVMEFLPGKSLNYSTDLALAAECLCDIHNLEVPEKHHLVSPKNPLLDILEESKTMAQVYLRSPFSVESIGKKIQTFLKQGEDLVRKHSIETRDFVLINTELNSGNFLINGPGKRNYIIDWEKPIYGEAAQDLGHFLAPTTTFWKTDVLLTPLQKDGFMKAYLKGRKNSKDLDGFIERVNIYTAMNCIRGITWCAMAWVEYQNPNKLIYNEFTYRKMQSYLTASFLNKISEEYFE